MQLVSERPLTSGEFDEGRTGLEWIGEDEILFTSNRSGVRETWKVKTDGTGLQKHALGVEVWWPVATKDRRFLFFYKKADLWRASIDGTDAKAVVPFIDQWTPPVATADNWVYFRKVIGDANGINRIPVGGGAPQLVWKGGFSDQLADGRLLVVENTPQTNGLGEVRQSVALRTPKTGTLTPLNDIPLIQTYPAVAPYPLRMTQNDRAVSYVDINDGLADVWWRSLSDGTKRRLTRLNTPSVFWFAWSPQGKLAVAHGALKRDVVRVNLDHQ